MAKCTAESALKNSAKQLLAYYRIITWPYRAGMGNVSGFPDRFGILPGGKFFALEFKLPDRVDENGKKRPATKLSEKQEKVRKQIEAAGGLYLVVRQLEDIIEGLNLPGRLF